MGLFQATFEKLSECLDVIDDSLNEEETVYRKLVIRLCNELGDYYEPDLDDE